MKANIPVLKCYPIGNGQVKAWCPFCKEWHIHGHGEKITSAKSLGHWNAECHDKNSPFHARGYYLKLMSKKEIADISAGLKFYEL